MSKQMSGMNRASARRLGSLLTAAALLIPLPSAAAAEATPGCFDFVVSATTFHVELKPDRSTYRAGTVATIHTTVTRPAHEDPAGLGQKIEPPESFPAPDVGVGVGLNLFGLHYVETSVTDGQGKASIDIKIPSSAPAGKVSGTGFAWKSVLSAPCASVEEFGRVQVQGLIQITR